LANNNSHCHSRAAVFTPRGKAPEQEVIDLCDSD
jgi:hypothetical protein